ncbi:MAG: hypothetical protein E6I99_01335 [Chloroflexi bacterium]|nr:MAG: hypothetical protein E6I99_01335 [Chloroflexota bacterium]
MSRRLIALLILAVTVLTACGRIQSTRPAAAGYRLFIAEGYGPGPQHITVRNSGTGQVERRLLLGTPSPDWSRYYTVTQVTGAAVLTALDPASGRTLNQTTIPETFELPVLGEGPTAGLSPDGRWIALVSRGPDAAGHTVTEFLVGSSSLSQPLTKIRLNGNFAFDALSNDGQGLYLIETMSDANHYRVRLYDVATRSLVAQPVVDKREVNEPMEGIRGDSIADPTGNQVFTVYVRDSGPFIHALPLLNQPFAWCVDLPSKATKDLETQFRWSLAIGQQGGAVYAVNSELGMVAEMTRGNPPAIARTKPVALNRDGNLLAGLVTDAEAKGPRIGGAALSADGRTLFAIAQSGVLAIDTATLQVRVRILDGESVDSLRLSADGKWLYAAGAADSKLWQLDPATGTVRGQVKGVTQPWALLWAEPMH